MSRIPICDYEGSDYQTSFWEKGGRAYEDKAEEIALKRMLPARGNLLLEIGAGAGRNTPRYTGYERIVLLDYSRTQLAQARARLGDSPRYTYVAADVYKMPFINNLFDGATMIRVLHHMAEAPRALAQVRRVLMPNAAFILEFANKLNLKSILRYWLGRQDWNPFTPEPVEFAALNFDFHPQTIRQWLNALGFQIETTRTVSHFRLGILKRALPASLLAALDSLLQPTGLFWQLTPSVFIKASTARQESPSGGPAENKNLVECFQCPECAARPLINQPGCLECPNCGRKWGIRDGIYDFKDPLL